MKRGNKPRSDGPKPRRPARRGAWVHRVVRMRRPLAEHPRDESTATETARADRGHVILRVTPVAGVRLVKCFGVLDATTFFQLRDGIIAAADDKTQAVIVDITHLTFTREALTVFATVETQLAHWPGIPLLLVCESLRAQQALRRSAVPHPVHWSVDAALAGLSGGQDTSGSR